MRCSRTGRGASSRAAVQAAYGWGAICVLPTLSPTQAGAQPVRQHLDRVLASSQFVNSHRLSRFLRFIVERTLDNAEDELKESVVGIQVFDRPAGYDPKIDSIVRVQARQLRSKLQMYYAEPGYRDTVRFEVPKGSYVLVIRTADEPRLLLVSPGAAAAKSQPAADLAVLPFANFSSDPETEYFSDGVSEEILTALSQVRGLRLIARTSSFQFKGRNRDLREVARALGTRCLLEGGVRRAGNQLRVTAQLIDGGDGTQLWAGSFDACLTEPAQMFAIQEDIARSISLSLGRVMTAPERPEGVGRPTSVAAYDLCLRARKLMRELRAESVLGAIPLLEAAIAGDPGYAAAYATLAGCYGHLGVYGGPAGAGALPKVRWYATEAVRRDPFLPDGHVLLGNAAAALDLDLATARTHYTRALEIDPEDQHARQSRAFWLLGPSGQTADAVEELERLLPLDPLSLDLRHSYTMTLLFDRRYEKVIEQASLILQIMPRSHSAAFCRWLAYEALGEDMLGMKDLALQAEVLPQLMIGEHMAAYELERSGQHEEAVAAATRLEQDPRAVFAPTVLADLWIRLGDLDRAVGWLETGYERRVFRVLWLAVDYTYDKLRPLPRFRALCGKVFGPRGQAAPKG